MLKHGLRSEARQSAGGAVCVFDSRVSRVADWQGVRVAIGGLSRQGGCDLHQELGAELQIGDEAGVLVLLDASARLLPAKLTVG
jgi:hypothetical protein